MYCTVHSQCTPAHIPLCCWVALSRVLLWAVSGYFLLFTVMAVRFTVYGSSGTGNRNIKTKIKIGCFFQKIWILIFEIWKNYCLQPEGGQGAVNVPPSAFRNQPLYRLLLTFSNYHWRLSFADRSRPHVSSELFTSSHLTFLKHPPSRLNYVARNPTTHYLEISSEKQ